MPFGARGTIGEANRQRAYFGKGSPEGIAPSGPLWAYIVLRKRVVVAPPGQSSHPPKGDALYITPEGGLFCLKALAKRDDREV